MAAEKHSKIIANISIPRHATRLGELVVLSAGDSRWAGRPGRRGRAAAARV